jgi:hypothetical protein
VEDRDLTRWQRARRDTRGVRVRREQLVVSVVVGALTVGVIFLVGGDWSDALIGLGCAVVAVVLLIPASELAWNYSQADKRLMMGELRAIRDRLDAAPTPGTAPPSEPPLDAHLTLHDLIRIGRALRNRHTVGAGEELAWANSVVERWGPLAPREQMTRFLSADGTSFRDQLAVLEQIANETRDTGSAT